MAPPSLPDDAACCFCAKGPTEVERLIAGPQVWICDACVRVCHGLPECLEAGKPALPEAVLADIARAHQLARSAGASAAFADVWERLGPDGDPSHRVMVAHYVADLQDEASTELEWDLRAGGRGLDRRGLPGRGRGARVSTRRCISTSPTTWTSWAARTRHRCTSRRPRRRRCTCRLTATGG